MKIILIERERRPLLSCRTSWPKTCTMAALAGTEDEDRNKQRVRMARQAWQFMLDYECVYLNHTVWYLDPLTCVSDNVRLAFTSQPHCMVSPLTCVSDIVHLALAIVRRADVNDKVLLVVRAPLSVARARLANSLVRRRRQDAPSTGPVAFNQIDIVVIAKTNSRVFLVAHAAIVALRHNVLVSCQQT